MAEETQNLLSFNEDLYGAINNTENEKGRSTDESRHVSLWRKIFSEESKEELAMLLKLAWPLILTALAQTLLSFVSITFCGQLGKVQLDAASLANSIINVTVLAVGMGLATACDTLFAQSYGSENKKITGLYLQKGLLIMLLACFPCWAIHLNTESLLRLMGQDEEMARLAGSYLLYFMPAVLFNFMFQVLSKYIQNQNVVLPNVIIGILANGVNAGLHYLFLYVLELGTDGSAFAQVAANVISFLGVLLVIVVGKFYEETWDGWTLECLHSWAPFIRLAFPGMLMICLEWWCFELGTILSGVLSPVDLGTQSIMFQMEAITFMIPLGIGIAVSIRVGQCLGSGDGERANLSAKISYCLTWISSLTLAILVVTLRYFIPKIFTQDKEVVSMSAHMLPILALFTVFDALAALGSGVLRGCGRQKVGAVVIFIGYYLISLPLGIPALMLTNFKVAGLWLAYAAGVIIEAMVFTVLVFTTNWRLEAEQAQVRAGVKIDPMLSAIGEEGTDDVSEYVGEDYTDDEKKAALEHSDRRKLLSRQTSHMTRSPERPPSWASRRRYSSSRVVSAVHAGRFSEPHVLTRKYSIPETGRRYSSRFSNQIKEDVLGRLEESMPVSTGRLLCSRGLALIICILFLVGGVMLRIYVRFPYHDRPLCIGLFPNGSYPVIVNATLPFCNTTDNS